MATKFKTVTKFPCVDLNQLIPPLKTRALQLIAECKKIGIPIRITQTFRSHEYQAKLHKENPNGAIEPYLSMHEYHVAFDYCINIKGKAYDPILMAKVGKIGQKLGMVWGGDWNGNGSSKDEKLVDMPHFQYQGKYTQIQIRKGSEPV